MTDLGYSPLMMEVRRWMQELPEETRTYQLLEWGEEQPHLYGFLINLADDFSGQEHEALTMLPLMLEEAFRRMGLPTQPIDPNTMAAAITDHVDAQGRRTDLQAEGEMSIRMPDELRKAWEFLSGVEKDSFIDREDVELVTRIMVSAYERAVPDKLQ